MPLLSMLPTCVIRPPSKAYRLHITKPTKPCMLGRGSFTEACGWSLTKDVFIASQVVQTSDRREENCSHARFASSNLPVKINQH